MPPRPLFILGNKRSGSTILANLLNAHARVFLSHEADTLWLLYQSRYGAPRQYRPHPLDSDMEMRTTLRLCGRILRSSLGPQPTREQLVETFHRVQDRLLLAYVEPGMRERAWRLFQDVGRRPTVAKVVRALRQKRERPRKSSLGWIGDKKHVQHIDPAIRPFILRTFPDARHVHILRHPRGVVASMMDAATHWRTMPDYFRGTAAEILEQWAIHEEWVQQAKDREDNEILTVRLEDLCANPEPAMQRVLAFLDLDLSDDVARAIPLMVHYRDPNAKYASFQLPELPRARAVMERYGYE
jgi:hypothetical protein